MIYVSARRLDLQDGQIWACGLLCRLQPRRRRRAVRDRRHAEAPEL